MHFYTQFPVWHLVVLSNIFNKGLVTHQHTCTPGNIFHLEEGETMLTRGTKIFVAWASIYSYS